MEIIAIEKWPFNVLEKYFDESFSSVLEEILRKWPGLNHIKLEGAYLGTLLDATSRLN